MVSLALGIRMKIALLVQTLGGGGAERVAVLLASVLQRQGAAVKLLVLREEKIVQEIDEAVRVEVLNVRRARYSFWRLRQALRGFDACIVFGWELGLTVGILKKLYLCSVPTVYREGRIPWFYLGKSGLMVYRSVIGAHDLVIAQTNYIRDWLSDLGLNPSRIRVIGNPIDFEGTVNARSDCSTGLKLVSAGRFSPEKGHVRLVEAFSSVLEIYPEARLILYGQGNLEETIHRRIQELGLDEFVEVKSFQPREEVFAEGSVFCLPSFSEGLSNALLEAISRGLPVIASGGESIREIMERFGLGSYYLSNEEFAEGFVRTVKAVETASPEVWSQAACGVRQTFSIDRIGSDFTEALQELRSIGG